MCARLCASLMWACLTSMLTIIGSTKKPFIYRFFIMIPSPPWNICFSLFWCSKENRSPTVIGNFVNFKSQVLGNRKARGILSYTLVVQKAPTHRGVMSCGPHHLTSNTPKYWANWSIDHMEPKKKNPKKILQCKDKPNTTERYRYKDLIEETPHACSGLTVFLFASASLNGCHIVGCTLLV